MFVNCPRGAKLKVVELRSGTRKPMTENPTAIRLESPPKIAVDTQSNTVDTQSNTVDTQSNGLKSLGEVASPKFSF